MEVRMAIGVSIVLVNIAAVAALFALAFWRGCR